MSLRARLTKLETEHAQQTPAPVLRRMCRCEVRRVDYRVAVAPLCTPSPERDALLARAESDRCATCHGHLYGGAITIAPVEWGVPVLTDSRHERTA